jgi:1-phosphofructokinase family hexose kinase
MNERVLTVTLNPAIDKIIQLPGFILGKDFKTKTSDVIISSGGKGINVSRALKSLGVANTATGFQGGGSGKLLQEHLQQERINNDFMPVRMPVRENLTIIDSVCKQITRILEVGPSISRIELQRFEKKISLMARKHQYIVLSGSLPSDVPVEYYGRIARCLDRSKTKVIVDASGKALKNSFSARPFLIKPNLAEAEEILNRKLDNMAAIIKAAKDFVQHGVEIAIISLGENGAVGVGFDQVVIARSPAVRVKSNVGCGDALLAGFIDAYRKKMVFSECLRWAVACGTVNAMNIQPGQINPAQVRFIMPRVSISIEHKG